MHSTSPSPRVRAVMATAGALLLLLLCLSTSAQAASTTSCRASAARVNVANLLKAEPVRANAPNTPCSTQSAETLTPTTIGPLTADAVTAYTKNDPKAESALAGVSKPAISLGLLHITAQAVQASAQATCNGDTPVLSSASRVVGLQINGQGVVLPSDDAPFSLALPGGGTIAVNQTTQAGGEITRRAVNISVPGVAEVVLAEARASIDSATCHGTTTTPTDPTTPPKVCPHGSIFDTGSGFCIIPGHDTVRTVIVGKPYQGPSGGTVIALPDARKKYKSPCLHGTGVRYAVIGTNGRDRITGTNRGDRILLLAGNDRADGGRGRDCLDGGSGRDKVAGGLGRDRLFGRSGRDHMLGGASGDRIAAGTGNDLVDGGGGRDLVHAGTGRDKVLGGTSSDRLYGGRGNDRLLAGKGNDRVYGQAGNDFLSAGYGRDRLYGGPGRDLLVATVFGPAAKMLNGGSGIDSARYNPSERHHTRHVEHGRVVS